MPGEIKAVLWDIDGTLISTGGAGAVAWQRAFEELYGIEANIDEHTRAGMTDPEITEIIFHEVIGRAGTPEERAKVVAKYLEHMPAAVAESKGYEVKPGIAAILPRLAEAGIAQGIVTGNVEPAARINRYRCCFARTAEIRATFRIRTETDRASDRLSSQRLLPNALPIANRNSYRDHPRRKAAQDLDADAGRLCPLGRAGSHQSPDGVADDRLPEARPAYRAGIGTLPQRL